MDAIPKMVGDKVEEFVGDTLNKVMGKEDKKQEEKGAVEQVMTMVGGKDDDKGFGIGDALSLVGGGDNEKKKEEGGGGGGGGGGGVAKMMGNFFK